LGSDRFVNLSLKALGIAGLLGILVASLLGNRHPIEQGVAAPPVEDMRYVDGKKVTLDLAQGRPLVINFWGTWCPPCIAELPTFAQAAKDYGERVEFYGLADSQQSTPAAIQKVVERFDITYDVGQVSGSTERAWNIQSYPTTFFVDGNGLVHVSFRGPMNREMIDEVLAEMLPATPAPGQAP
jgi:thiol-disulfide isomerase/thioredoxin